MEVILTKVGQSASRSMVAGRCWKYDTASEAEYPLVLCQRIAVIMSKLAIEQKLTAVQLEPRATFEAAWAFVQSSSTCRSLVPLRDSCSAPFPIQFMGRNQGWGRWRSAQVWPLSVSWHPHDANRGSEEGEGVATPLRHFFPDARSHAGCNVSSVDERFGGSAQTKSREAG